MKKLSDQANGARRWRMIRDEATKVKDLDGTHVGESFQLQHQLKLQ